MKYVKQFLIILLISFIGEGLNYLIPAPVPASIYGMVILFVCLCTKVVKLDDVKDTGMFLIEIMPRAYDKRLTATPKKAELSKKLLI